MRASARGGKLVQAQVGVGRLTRLADVTGALGKAVAALPRNAAATAAAAAAAAAAKPTVSVIANTTSSCPISAATYPLNLSGVGPACVAGKNYCSSCICALFDVYTPALVAAGLLLPGMPLDSIPVDAATQVIRDCTIEYYAPLLVAQANFTSLSQLGSCDFSGMNVPACLTTNYVSASSGMDPATGSVLPGANSTAGMYVADPGMMLMGGNMTVMMSNFTLTNITVVNGDIMGIAAGQVSSVGEVLSAILTNPDITSDLGSDAMAYLEQLVATPGVAAAALPDAVSSTLSSPAVDVSVLLSQIADFATAAGNMTAGNMTVGAPGSAARASFRVGNSSMVSGNMTGPGMMMPTDVAATPKARPVNATMKAPSVTSAAGPADPTPTIAAPSSSTATAAPAPASASASAPAAAAPVHAPSGSALPTPAASVLTLVLAAVGGVVLSSML
ncbi:MAG: hypothetical protein WDW38_011251 [Sanguina aurantia]